MRTYQIMRLASLFESIAQQNNIIGGFKIEKLISANNNLQNTITNKNLNSWLFIKGTNHMVFIEFITQMLIMVFC